MPTRDYNWLDSKLFRAFLAAAETENFTNAAKRAFMTQSGVSQHVAKLEEQVGVPLFKRLGRRVVLTQAGKSLARFVKQQASGTGSFLDQLRDGHEALAGKVSYAMPSSCLLSPHFPMLLEKRLPYPELTLEVTLSPSEDVVELLLADRIDFGFVTSLHDHPQLAFELFCREEYILVGSDAELLQGIDDKNVCQQRYITYPGVDVYIDAWLGHHFPQRRNVDFYSLSPTGSINSIEGAIRMVLGGLGLSVFPRHCVDEYLTAGRLFEYQEGREPLLNEIYFVTLAEHDYPRTVRQVLAWFREMHCEG